MTAGSRFPSTGRGDLDRVVEAAQEDASRAAAAAGVTVVEAKDDAATRLIYEAGEAVWGPRGTFAPNELRALAFSGNPVHLAMQGARVVGFAVGFLGWAPALHVHSHQAGVLDVHRRRGVGYALKLAQRHTCLGHGVTEMRWTFDPLVRRNVAFNLNALGADAVAFYPDFYGPMSDTINAGDASDRLEAVWDLTRPLPDRGTRAHSANPRPGRAAREGSRVPRVLLRDRDGEPLPTELAPEEGAVLEVPADYEGLRAADRPRSGRWRQAVREQLSAVYAAGLQVGAVDPEGYRVAGP